jgi:hypothetical protein
MAIHILAVGETKNIAVSSRYLSIVELDGQMRVSSPQFGVKPFSVKAGYQADMNGITSAMIENIDTVTITANVEDAGVKISAQGGGAVTVTNKVVVDRIEQPQEFSANVTFDGGNVGIISPDSLKTLDDVECPINTATLVVPAGVRNDVIVQNRGVDDLRVGGNAVNANRGFVLEGGSSLSLGTQAAVFAYNASGGSITVTITEI